MTPANTIGIKRLSDADGELFIALLRIFEEAFAMPDFVPPAPSYLYQLLNREDFHVFVALHGSQVLGGLTAYTLQQYYSETPLVYIYDLAVDSRYRRQGIGKKLVNSLNEYSHSIGAAEMFVQADEEDKHALDFYHALGGTAQRTVQFTLC